MRIAIVLSISLISIAQAFAGDQGDPDADCGVSTYEMVDCLNAKAAQWDKRMGIAYQRSLKAGGDKQRNQLRAAQRLWIQYRDANCLYYALGEGTISRVEAADCLFRMTKSRAEELEGKEDRN